MKTDFSTVTFSVECRAILDGHDGWARDQASKQHDLEDNFLKGYVIIQSTSSTAHNQGLS